MEVATAVHAGIGAHALCCQLLQPQPDSVLVAPSTFTVQSGTSRLSHQHVAQTQRASGVMYVPVRSVELAYAALGGWCTVVTPAGKQRWRKFIHVQIG